MQARLINRWDAVRDSFWFLPALCCGLAALLAVFCTLLDERTGNFFADKVPWVAVSPSAARASLSTIGSALVSIAGIVFSVMLVTLSITSSQYGSRLLRTFMADRVTQSTLGVLLGTSLFSLLALAVVRDDPDRFAAANVSVIMGLLLAILSIGVLIVFIHHVASLIQAPNVVAAVANDLDVSLDRLFPEHIGKQKESPVGEIPNLDQLGSGQAVRSAHEGYVQAIDADVLMEKAKSNDLFIHLMIKPGEFLERDQKIVEFWHFAAVFGSSHGRVAHESLDLDESLAREINEAVVAGRRRTPRQDAECALEELVEVAVRALSPGINDPFTAIACIDHLAATLGRAAERAMPLPLRHDDEGAPRVLARATCFPDLMDAAFNQIRQYGCQSVAVAIRLLQAFQRIASHVSTHEQWKCLHRHAEMVQRDFRAKVNEPEDGDDFREEYEELTRLLSAVEERVRDPGRSSLSRNK